MPHIAQHEAAELWELCRDHAVAAAKLRQALGTCQDPQLRDQLQRHAQHFQQAAQRLYQLLQEPGAAAYAGTWQAATGVTWQATPGPGVGQVGTYAGPQAGMQAGQAYGAGIQPGDVVLAGDCLRLCKTFAVQCVWGATESSHPAREALFQLAGEHLRMADEHYRWLEQRGVYASPRADQAAIQQYTGKLQQLMTMGQATAPYAYAAAAQASPSYGYPGAGQGAMAGGYGQGTPAHGYAAYGQGGGPSGAYGWGQPGGYGAGQAGTHGAGETGRYGGGEAGPQAGAYGGGAGGEYGYGGAYPGAYTGAYADDEGRGYGEAAGEARAEGFGGYRAYARAGDEEPRERRPEGDAY